MQKSLDYFKKNGKGSEVGMIREDTLEGLELCLKGLCDICPYIDSNAPGGCKDELMHDAMILLEAQEPIKPYIQFSPAGQPMWCCGNCGTTLFFKFPRQTDDADERKHHRFCHYCGQAVKWE